MDHVVPERLKDREMVVRYVSRAGQSRFHGGSHLKGSQAYPAGFLGGLSIYTKMHPGSAICFLASLGSVKHFITYCLTIAISGLAVPFPWCGQPT